MAVYYKVSGTTLYIRGSSKSGYSQYFSGGGAIGRTAYSTVTTVTVEENVSFPSDFDASNMFSYFSLVTSLDLSKFDTSNIKNMTNMFTNCTKLTSLNISSFNTSNVIGMGGMFEKCENLISIDVSSFDTSKVTDMASMFYRCKSIESLNLSSFDTSNVIDMNSMFDSCYNLEELNISSFDTSNVMDMSYMFSDLYLTTLDLSNFNTSNVRAMEGMFYGCEELIDLNVTSFNTSNVTEMAYMFSYCYMLDELNLSSFNTSGVTDMEEMFSGDENLISVYISNKWTYNSQCRTPYMLDECISLVGQDGSTYDEDEPLDKTHAHYGNGGWFKYLPNFIVNFNYIGYGSASYSIDPNDICTLTAEADYHNHFASWSGDVSSTDNPYSFAIDSDKNITVTFEEDEKLNVIATSNIKGNNIYISDPHPFPGDIIRLLARPVPKYVFKHWSDGDTSNIKSMEVDNDILIEAIYDPFELNTESKDWYVYIKGSTDINGEPKAFLRCSEFTFSLDLCTTANSKFILNDLTQDMGIVGGDILVLINPQGVPRYNGVVKSISGTTIQTSQMQSFYSGTCLFDFSGGASSGTSNAWTVKIYEKVSSDYPKPEDFEGLTPTSTQIVLDKDNGQDIPGSDFSVMATTYLYFEETTQVTSTYTTDDNGTLTINGVFVTNLETTQGKEVTYNFNKGWNEIIICFTEDNGDAYFKIRPRFHDGSSYSISTLTDMNTALDITIEENFIDGLSKFASGYIRGSSYQDELMNLEKSPVKIIQGSFTDGRLVSENDEFDMEQFIYDLWKNYSIMLDFTIPFEPWTIGDNSGGTCRVYKPIYEVPLVISDNNDAIITISPTDEIQDVNKLVVFSQDGLEYRTTFIYTANGIVEEPSSIATRFSAINTKIVKSDDSLEDIKKAYLPEEIFNHKLTFALRLSNNLYKYDDFKLGMPVNVYVDKSGDFYSSVITGVEMSKTANQNIVYALFTCGNARTALTKRLTRKFGVL